MDEDINEMLEGEIRTELRSLYSLEPGSKEQSEGIDNVVKLYKLKIESDRSELDDRLKKEQLSEQRKDRWAKLGITAGKLIFYAAWMYAGFRFEEKGSICSPVFKDLIRHFSPGKD